MLVMIKRGSSLHSVFTHTYRLTSLLRGSFQVQAGCLLTQEAYDTIGPDLLLAGNQNWNST